MPLLAIHIKPPAKNKRTNQRCLHIIRRCTRNADMIAVIAATVQTETIVLDFHCTHQKCVSLHIKH